MYLEGDDTQTLAEQHTNRYFQTSRQYDIDPYPLTTTGTPDGAPVVPWTGEPISDYIERFQKYDLLAFMKKYESIIYPFSLPFHVPLLSPLNLPSSPLLAKISDPQPPSRIDTGRA
jgi:hypothetical protein